jgi:hypothetical protein
MAYIGGALALGEEKAVIALLTLLGGLILKSVDEGGISDPALQKEKTSVTGHTKSRENKAAPVPRNKAKHLPLRPIQLELDFP